MVAKAARKKEVVDSFMMKEIDRVCFLCKVSKVEIVKGRKEGLKT